MRLESRDFKHNEDLPSKFTCDGQGSIPHLRWEDFPKETRSFAIIMHDPDAVSGTFIHWVVHDIPLGVNEITNSLPKGAKEMDNTARIKGYFPPCPPSGTGVHRYMFTVYALDVETLDSENFSEIKEHAIDSAQLIGLYKRD